MAAATHAVGTADTGNTPNASGAFTPALGDLLIVFVIASDTASAGTLLTSSIAGNTFTLFSGASFRGGVDVLLGFVANQLIETGEAISQTVTFNPSDAATGSIIFVCRISGMKRTGFGAIVQFASQSDQAAAGTPAPTFLRAALTGNLTLGAIGNSTSPAGMTAPGGWTEGTADLGYSTPLTGGEYVFRNSGFTGTTVTWGSTSASAFASMIVELNTSEINPYHPDMQRAPVLAQ